MGFLAGDIISSLDVSDIKLGAQTDAFASLCGVNSLFLMKYGK